jgi:hypothetical protein
MAREMSFATYSEFIRNLPTHSPLRTEDLFCPGLLIHQWGKLAQYYAPFDYVNRDARLVIAGITPGWNQMEIATRVARDGLLRGQSTTAILATAKYAASFAGSMRSNLVSMLDALGLPGFLNIASTGELFTTAENLLHPTSAIRYPVFKDGGNYAGANPHPLKDAYLLGFVENTLAADLDAASSALVVPLGKSVEDSIHHLIKQGCLDPARCLTGFPHPSGANGHRLRQFAENRSQLHKKIRQWFAAT